MSIPEVIWLLVAAFAAGIINAVAGGGTMLTFPALLFFGTPPLIANATSTLALVIGTAGSIFGFRRHIKEIKPWLRRLVPVSLVGGGIGSILLTRTSDRIFSEVVPFLLLFATILFLAQSLFQAVAGQKISEAQGRPLPQSYFASALIMQLGVGIYGGYFGAGIGILMLASLGFLGLTNIHEMNTLKNVLGSLINLVAALIFIGGGLIDWPRAAIMTIGALAGYLVGSTYSQKIPQFWIRRVIGAVGLLITGYLFYRNFRRDG